MSRFEVGDFVQLRRHNPAKNAWRCAGVVAGIRRARREEYVVTFLEFDRTACSLVWPRLGAALVIREDELWALDPDKAIMPIDGRVYAEAMKLKLLR